MTCTHYARLLLAALAKFLQAEARGKLLKSAEGRTFSYIRRDAHVKAGRHVANHNFGPVARVRASAAASRVTIVSPSAKHRGARQYQPRLDAAYLTARPCESRLGSDHIPAYQIVGVWRGERWRRSRFLTHLVSIQGPTVPLSW